MTNRGTVQSMILVTGAIGNVGRHVVSQLLRTGAAVRALTHNPESASLPGDVVRGDLSGPGTPDAYPEEVEAIGPVRPFFTAEATFPDAVTKHARRIVYLSSEGIGDNLQQQTDIMTVRIAAKLAA